MRLKRAFLEALCTFGGVVLPVGIGCSALSQRESVDYFREIDVKHITPRSSFLKDKHHDGDYKMRENNGYWQLYDRLKKERPEIMDAYYEIDIMEWV